MSVSNDDRTGADSDPTATEPTTENSLPLAVHPTRVRVWPPQNINATHSTRPRYTLPLPNPPPQLENGARTPNRLPWAHSPRDFYRVVLPPPPSVTDEDSDSKGTGTSIWSRRMIREAWGEDAFDYELSDSDSDSKGTVTCIWSRSMIREVWGEDAFDYELSDGKGGECASEPTPRIRKPWPVLGLCTRRISTRNEKLNLAEEERKLGLGVIDEGSDHNHDGKFETREDRGQEPLDSEDGGVEPEMSQADIEECKDLLRWAIEKECVDELCIILDFPSFHKIRDEIEGRSSDRSENSGDQKVASISAYLENVAAASVLEDSVTVATATGPIEDISGTKDDDMQIVTEKEDVGKVDIVLGTAVENGGEGDMGTKMVSESEGHNVNAGGVDTTISNGSCSGSGSVLCQQGKSESGEMCSARTRNVGGTDEEGKGVKNHDGVIGTDQMEDLRDSDDNEGHNVLSVNAVEGGVDTIISSGCCSGSVSCQQVKSGEGDVMSSAGKEVARGADVDMKIDGNDEHVNVPCNEPMSTSSHKDPEVSNPTPTDALVKASAVVNTSEDDVKSDDPPAREAQIPESTLSWKRRYQILRLGNIFHQRWRSLHSADPDMASIICDGGTRFETQGVPKLEEWIPERYLPETLVVHDPDHVSSLAGYRTISKRKYRRVFPRPASICPSGGENNQVSTPTPMTDGDADPFRPTTTTAHLYLSASARLGSGNHSYVYRAVLQLPAPLMARDSPNGEVTVAAKVSTSYTEDRDSLNYEGMMYSNFEKHLAEDWCGFNSLEGEEGLVRPCAVVPKFYGFYLSEEDKRWDSAILLLEECGTPVKPEQLTRSQRVEMYSLYRLLHHAKYLQMSAYIRNMLVQPGPLTLPPRQRSMETPSFRIIDFGRGGVIGSNYNDEDVRYEEKKALRELLLGI